MLREIDTAPAPERHATMLLSRLAAVICVTAVLIPATACTGPSNVAPQAGQTSNSVISTAPSPSVAPVTHSSTSAAAISSAADDSHSAAPSFINGGAALADTGDLVDVLEAVDPKIGTNKNDLIAKSKALCANINASDSDSRLQADAEKTFTNGTWVPSDAEAQAIVGTVKAYGGC